MFTLYGEDFAVGDEFDYGSYTLTKEEIIEFAEKYDPQPFHVDEAAAEASMFGGLVASGWQVAALTTRMITDALFERTALEGGHGTDELRFHHPVRPGDTLSGTVEVVEVSEPENRSHQLDVSFEQRTVNQDGDLVLSMINHGMVGKRDSTS